MPTLPTVDIFAYGSNLCRDRMADRVRTALPVATGFVAQRKLAFHKVGIDGSAKADARFTGRDEDRVWGVIYRLPVDERSILDKHESLGIGYDLVEVDVTAEFGLMRAHAYIARAEAIQVGLLPFCWYHAFLMAGAKQQALPEEYIADLQRVPTVADPDHQRRARNDALISR